MIRLSGKIQGNKSWKIGECGNIQIGRERSRRDLGASSFMISGKNSARNRTIIISRGNKGKAGWKADRRKNANGETAKDKGIPREDNVGGR